MTITKLGEEYQIVIPKEVRKVLNLQPGDRLNLKVINGTVVMTKEISYASRLFGKHRQLWQGENAVDYIRQQRESWRDYEDEKMQTINLILSISLISIFCFIGIYPLTINLAFAETTSQEQEPPGSLFENIRNAITDKKPPVKETPAGSRGSFCAIAPFSPKETIEVFSETPIFIWQGEVTRIRIKIGGSEEIVWSVRASRNERKKVYGGDELQPGQTYDVFFVPDETRYPFRVIDGDRRESIQAELDALAADGDATAEEIALQRAGYFLEEGLLMDALREMLSVENPSVELQEAVGRISTAIFCET